MQLPRLAVLLAVYSGVHATLSPDEPTGKPEVKSETNQTGGSRFLGLGGPSGFMTSGYGGSGMGSYQPQYSQSQAQAQAQGQSAQAQAQALSQPQPQVYSSGPQTQPQVFRVPAIETAPYRTSSQFSPYSGMSGGVVEQMSPLMDDGYPSSPSKFGSFQGNMGGMSLPQTLTVIGNIPVTVSGTLSLGVRGQLTVLQDGGSGSGTNSEGQSGVNSSPIVQQAPPTFQPYQGVSSGTITGSFPGSQQTYNGHMYTPLTTYQHGMLSPVSPYTPALGGSLSLSGSPFFKPQSEESEQFQTQVITGNGESSQVQLNQNSGSTGLKAIPIIRPYTPGGFSQSMGSPSGMTGSVIPPGQTGFGSMSSQIQKQMQITPIGGQMQQSNFQVLRPGGAGQPQYSMRYADAVARALNDEQTEKTET